MEFILYYKSIKKTHSATFQYEPHEPYLFNLKSFKSWIEDVAGDMYFTLALSNRKIKYLKVIIDNKGFKLHWNKKGLIENKSLIAAFNTYQEYKKSQEH